MAVAVHEHNIKQFSEEMQINIGEIAGMLLTEFFCAVHGYNYEVIMCVAKFDTWNFDVCWE